MKFQDSSFNGFKVTVGTKIVTHAPTNRRSKSNMHHQLFQSWGHNKIEINSQSKHFDLSTNKTAKRNCCTVTFNFWILRGAKEWA